MILPVRLAEIAAKLDPLGLNYAFVGGSVVEFLLDHFTQTLCQPPGQARLINF